MNATFIKSTEKKEIVKKLNEDFGIEKVPQLLIRAGKEKIRGFSGTISKEELMELGDILHIEIVGQYLFKEENEKELRLSFDATQLFSGQITKRVIEISDQQYYEWIRGRDLPIKAEKGVLIIKYKRDFVGCGRSNGEVIFNYVPRERQIKKG